MTYPYEELWATYWSQQKLGGDVENEIVTLHLHLVKSVADRIYSGLPNSVDYEELMQNGRFGLMDAVRNWKPALSAFKTYANLKIKSKILDGLRQADWLSRDMRRHVRTVHNAAIELETELNRTPTDKEVADKLDITVQEVTTARVHHSTSHISSLDNMFPTHDPNNGDAGNISYAAHLHDATETTPHEHAEQKQEQEHLRRALAALPDRDRQIIALYYYENLTLANIGEILNITESRVCQIRSRALSSLAAALGDNERPLSLSVSPMQAGRASDAPETLYQIA